MRKWFGLGIVGLLLVPAAAFGEMNSNSFRIYADSFGLNGGDVASSTSYSLNDTFNDSIGGQSASTTYSIYGGYQAMDPDGTISITLNNSSIGLGTLSRTEITTGSAIATVTTNVRNGFTLSISDVSGSMITGVSDGTVTVGSEEYGVAVTGSYAAFADDRSVVAGRVLASSPNEVIGATTTIAFKAAISSGSAAATYSQTLTLTASANF